MFRRERWTLREDLNYEWLCVPVIDEQWNYKQTTMVFIIQEEE